MKIQYDFQMENLKEDKRFQYDDEAGTYTYNGDGIDIIICVWNKKIKVYNKLCDIYESARDLLALKYVLQMVDDEKYEEDE